jgi:hypothetical protein
MRKWKSAGMNFFPKNLGRSTPNLSGFGVNPAENPAPKDEWW